MIQTLSFVAIGGAIGSVLRYLLVGGIGAPVGTLVVNVLGGFVMGVLFILLANRTSLSPLLMTGVLGGFTTFSAFSLDALKLWEGGQTLQALMYVLASVILSLVAVALGAALAAAFGAAFAAGLAAAFGAAFTAGLAATAFFATGLAAALAAGLAAAALAATGFLAAVVVVAAALVAGFFAAGFFAAVAITSSPSSGMGKFTYKI